ncbi:MAG: hypothetical protein Q7W55_00910 [Pseudohongiella sp.]|nr:hypothetical protein [Pseudohongiella sp.]
MMMLNNNRPLTAKRWIILYASGERKSGFIYRIHEIAAGLNILIKISIVAGCCNTSSVDVTVPRYNEPSDNNTGMNNALLCALPI